MDSSTCSVDGISEEIIKLSKETLIKLSQTWEEMHEMTDDLRLIKMKQFIEYTQDFFNELLDSQEKRKMQLVDEIEIISNEHKELQRELNLVIEINIKGSEPLEVMKNRLEESIKDFRKIKEERLSKMAKLRSEERDLCTLLEVECLDPFTGFPSQSDLESIEQRIFELLQEKCEREQFMIEAKYRIQNCLNILDLEPQLQFEKEIFNGKLQLTTSNMTKLKDWELCLNAEIESATDNKNSLIEKLTKLWNRVKVDENYRTEFLVLNSGVGKSTIINILSELERCEEIKLANIKPAIDSARKELKSLWDLCMFDDEQISKFPAYSIDTYNEDILDLLEIEIESLKKHYSDNKQLFELASEWEELLKRAVQLEHLAKDTARLFNNRGGQLLKEEKERKTLNKKLPTAHKQLVELLNQYNNTNLRNFMWKGHDLLEKVTNDWEDWLKEHKTCGSTKKRGIINSSSESDEVHMTRSCRKILTENNTGNTPRSVKRTCPSSCPVPSKRVCKTPISSSKTPTFIRTPITQKPPTQRKGTPYRVVKTPVNLRSKVPTPCTPKFGTTPKNLKFAPSKLNFNI